MKNLKVKLIISVIICILIWILSNLFFSPKDMEGSKVLNITRYIFINVIPLIILESILLKNNIIKNKYIKLVITAHCIGLSIGAVVIVIYNIIAII